MNGISQEMASGEGAAERDEDLLAMVKRLEGFCSHVAHDLRGALSGIAGLAELAAAALDERQDSGSALRSLALIKQQAHRSSQMLSGLLRLAQVRDGALQISRVDLQVVAEQVAQDLAVCHPTQTMPELSIRPMPVVAADADLLRAVLFNLMDNAVKFTRESSDARIEIDATTSDEATVTVCVCDNGVGFDAARTDILFTPFSRLHGRRYEGSGIGLSIVRHAVERLGGRVWAHGAPGQGARFFFTLSLARADDVLVAPRDAIATTPASDRPLGQARSDRVLSPRRPGR